MSRSSSIVVGAGAGIVALAVTVWLPLCHWVPLKQTQGLQARAEFNPTNFAAAFWNEKLLPSLDRAAEAGPALAALAADPPAARARYGHKTGVSSSTLFFLRGTGRVVAVKKTGVVLALWEGADTADVLLPTGLLFGNTVRDGTGLLDASAFPNSQNFNDLSTELNRIIETTVLPALRERARVGAQVTFTGCAEVADEDPDFKPLKVVPVAVKIQ